MRPRVLFIIASDPRVSPRAAEAIRIAAGIAPWQKADITVYLRDAAVLALGESLDELLDEENFTRYLPMVGEAGRPILVQRGAPLFPKFTAAPLTFDAIDDRQLAALAAQSNCVLRF